MWKSRTVKLVVLCGVALVVIRLWPDIRRYIKMERM
ncbi:DUF6893 family small protein [Nonomuraea angiospora]